MLSLASLDIQAWQLATSLKMRWTAPSSEILYVANAKGSDKEALSRLYQHMVRLFPEAHIISHKADDPPAIGWSKVGRDWRVHGVPYM